MSRLGEECTMYAFFSHCILSCCAVPDYACVVLCFVLLHLDGIALYCMGLFSSGNVYSVIHSFIHSENLYITLLQDYRLRGAFSSAIKNSFQMVCKRCMHNL